MAEIKVDKIGAATRQLELAIRLLFQNEDPIGIHTLVAAAFRILRDIGKAKNSDIHQYLTAVIKPEMQGKFWKVFSHVANFCKHADSDPDAILEGVQEEVNDVLILLACFFYRDIELNWTPPMVAFVAWYIVIHPTFIDCLQDDPVLRQIVQNVEMSMIRVKSRDEQLNEGKMVLEMASVWTKNI